MTLEDFCTLTEMKDGLTSLARVEELISVMKKEKDTKNFPDATRQWSAVASAISATENKECLDLFIKLDGLWFIERWLKVAQSFTKETSDCFVEEAISALLQAVGRLQIENEKLISSGICITVENLLSYRSSQVQDRARALFDSWKAKDVDLISVGVEKALISSDPEVNNNKHIQTTADDCLPKLKRGEKTNDQDNSQVTSNHIDSIDIEQRINEKIYEELKPERMVENAKYDNKVQIVVSDGTDNSSRHESVIAEETITNAGVNANDGLAVEPSNGMDKGLDQGDGSSAKDREKTKSDKKEAKKHRKEKKSKRKYFGNSCEFSKNSKNSDVIRQTQDMDLENGIVDALEVARLVAKEVEREVGGYYGQSDSSSASSSSSSSSSSESISRSSSQEPESQESKELPEKEHSPKLENHVQDMESSQVTESNTEKSACGFDLNQEFSSEDPQPYDLQADTTTISNPASIVSASRAIASTEIPAAPLHFEGNLGWKGSAATSAFRAASPRNRHEFLDIDLNVAEASELSPEKTEKLIKFDLNVIGDDGDVPSPASSSCIQPTMRNFNLNDNPDQLPFLRDFSSSQKVGRYVGPPSDDSVISILGTNGKNTFPIHTPLPNLPLPFPIGSRLSEPSVDSSFLRRGSLMGLGHSVTPFPPQSVYTYNGFSMGPTSQFPSQIYGPNGPFPYMIDPRGSPFMAQMVGSTSMMGPTPMSNTVSQFRPNVDTNTRYFEGGSRDSLFYRPLFIPGQAVRPPLEEQMRENFFRPLNSSSSGSGKRKEPETGWELFPTNYKHHQPPHL